MNITKIKIKNLFGIREYAGSAIVQWMPEKVRTVNVMIAYRVRPKGRKTRKRSMKWSDQQNIIK